MVGEQQRMSSTSYTQDTTVSYPGIQAIIHAAFNVYFQFYNVGILHTELC